MRTAQGSYISFFNNTSIGNVIYSVVIKHEERLSVFISVEENKFGIYNSFDKTLDITIFFSEKSD